jgi:hypothetical protein
LDHATLEYTLWSPIVLSYAPVWTHLLVLGLNGIEWPLIQKDSLGLRDAINGRHSLEKLDGMVQITNIVRFLKFRVLHLPIPWCGGRRPTYTPSRNVQNRNRVKMGTQ